MSVITVRRLDQDVVEKLKAKARQNGRSMEEEARIAITRSVGGPLRGLAAVDHFTALQKELFGDRVFEDSTDFIREMRDEDPTAWDGR